MTLKRLSKIIAGTIATVSLGATGIYTFLKNNDNALYELPREVVKNLKNKEADKRGKVQRVVDSFPNEVSYSEKIVDPVEIGGKGRIKIKAVDFNHGASENPAQITQSLSISSRGADEDSSLEINQTIASCNQPAQINLTSGVYIISSPIKMKSNVILKGEGIRKTVLYLSGANASIEFLGDNACFVSKIKLGAVPGSKSLQLEDRLNFNDALLILGLDTSSYLVSDKNVLGADGFVHLYPSHFLKYPAIGGDFNSLPFYGQIARAKSAVNGEVELCEKLKLNYAQDLVPTAKIITRPIEFAGLEDITIETDGVGDWKPSVSFEGSSNCWIKNCELSNTRLAHVWAVNSKNLTITGNYIHHGERYDGKDGLYGYGVCLSDFTSDSLVEDNTFQSLRHAMIIQNGANGNVFSYNFVTESNPQNIKEGGADFSAHGRFPYMNLAEGNKLGFIHSSDMFGQAGPLQTIFRNRIEDGFIALTIKPLYPVVVGNVLTPGAIYLDKDGIGEQISGNVVRASSNALNRITCGENNFATEQYENPSAGLYPSIKLIPSLYLSKKPEFLQGTNWPCFGPDVKEETILPSEKRFNEEYHKWQKSALAK